MKENFIKTLSIETRPYIFRYELQPSAKSYIISVINHREIDPFEMIEENSGSWKIVNTDLDFLSDVEHLLSEEIVSQNSFSEVGS